MLPIISNLAPGAVVPIPTLPPFRYELPLVLIKLVTVLPVFRASIDPFNKLKVIDSLPPDLSINLSSPLF